MSFRLSLLFSLSLILLSSLLAFGAPAGTGADFKGPVGLQLYSLRDQFKKNVPATLDEVKSFGIQYVELAGTYDLSPEKFKEELTKRGLEAVSAHFPFEKFRDD